MGISPWNKGKPWSIDMRDKLSKAHLGQKHTAEQKAKIAFAHKGSKSHHWKGGITTQNHLIRNGAAMRDWRKHVFQRDNYTCQACGDRSGSGHTVVLNADHVMPFAFYPDLRFEILNGQTLCKPCHFKTPTFANPKNIYELD